MARDNGGRVASTRRGPEEHRIKVSAFSHGRFEFALVDLHLPAGNVLQLLRDETFSENTGVVVMTAFGGIKEAVEAIRLGAGDYLTKPFELEQLPLAFQRCSSARRGARREEHVTRQTDANAGSFFFGASLNAVRTQVDAILATDRRLGHRLPPVLIEGETGTGKSVLARWLHREGPRADHPFVPVNCAALSDTLIESELFGHERGAFTDAKTARLGLFEAADGGTLFLDEIGLLSPSTQAKLLTAIEEGVIRRLGGTREILVDVRVLTASNRPLGELVAAGAFREDLFHRLNLLAITLPPLRERGTDIIALAHHLLAKIAAHLPAAHREGLLAMTIFDADGIVLEKIPSNQPLVELPPDDFVRLHAGRPITRYGPAFSLETMLEGAPAQPSPVLEIVLPLHRRSPSTPLGGDDGMEGPIGFVRYHLDARTLAIELASLDAGVRRQTVVTLTVGLAALGLLVGAAYAMLGRAQRTIAERTSRLQRANFELTLAAKTSALGQITSHLVHGLQGPVAGLRSMGVAPDGVSARDWKTAAGYAEQMQSIIQEIVGLLGDQTTATAYELTGRELAEIIRRRNLPSVSAKGVTLEVDQGFPEGIDSHRGGLLCLIASNLVQNAIEAAAHAGCVTVSMRRDAAGSTLQVRDDGPGIPPEIREHLFEPGHTGRAGGTGLGLAISQLLARQIGASLVLEATGPAGTTFRVTVPENRHPPGGPA